MSVALAKKYLKQYFGYEDFRPMQAEIIETVIQKKDCLVLMPTGGGKSVTFQIPSLIQEGITIVVSPLIALMKDQVDSLTANGIKAAFLNSSQSNSELQNIENKAIKGEIKILYVSPEKIVSESFSNFLKQLNVNLFAIDEAHCISQWGHDFRPEYTQLKFIKKYYPEIPIIALTATADKITARDIIKQLELVDCKQFISSFDRPNLSLTVLPGQKRIEKVLDFLEKHKNQAGIIYCLSRKTTEEVASRLKSEGYKADFYHAGLPSDKRSQVQTKFINDNIQIICATIAFGMGIDKSNVRWVIHYNMPKNIENYYQEIGRSGRDGSQSDTLMFYSYQDVSIYRNFISESQSNKEVELAKLQRIQEFAEAQTCRRKILLSYFGEYLDKDCGNCDVCKNPPEHLDGTIIAQMALSAIIRTDEKVGINMLVDILRGSQKADLLEKGFDKIKTYGVGKSIGFYDWQQYILQLINQGFIEIAFDQNNNLKATQAAEFVLRKNRKVILAKPIEPKQRNDENSIIEKPISKTKVLNDTLFERLRQLRKSIADSENVPAYVVFSDSTLEDMVSKKPTSYDEMSNISGVGDFKNNKYGENFIAEIIAFIREKSDEGAKIKGATYLISYEMFNEGKTVDEIATERKLSITTIISHLSEAYNSNKPLKIENIISESEIEEVRKAIIDLGDSKVLKPIFEYLEQKIDYGKIRFAITYLNKNNII